MKIRPPRLVPALHVAALFSLAVIASAAGCGASANSGSIETRTSVRVVGDAHPTGCLTLEETSLPNPASGWPALAAIEEPAPPRSVIRPLAAPFIRLPPAAWGILWTDDPVYGGS